MDQFPPNSNRARSSAAPSDSPRSAEHVIEPLEGIVVQVRKKPIGSRMLDSLFKSEDSVARYLLREVVVPQLKDLLADFVKGAVEKSLYGEVRSTTSRGIRAGAPTQYHSRFTPTGIRPATTIHRSPVTTTKDPGESNVIIVGSRGQAQQVLEAIENIMQTYEVVTAADLNSLLKQSPEYTDRRWGWKDLRGFSYMPYTNGQYRLIVPPAIDLGN